MAVCKDSFDLISIWLNDRNYGTQKEKPRQQTRLAELSSSLVLFAPDRTQYRDWELVLVDPLERIARTNLHHAGITLDLRKVRPVCRWI